MEDASMFDVKEVVSPKQTSRKRNFSPEELATQLDEAKENEANWSVVEAA